ncbi:TetR/AcrR family transcriptional regulator [Actinosynnema sp. NPDC047251]|uniref:Transcriptional regulator, TetR family n=1 Tax=Saccharothrix espanaensis (strain ATCC 51144 / DSM 44229 / JCM 9112 / NBRC 15066 / NRRL 15764) TaxID=1179773 RepID=K0K323_SACES|nr:TetR/AcrR family transcriptional regulator [Saccharothrix espanaensis]CCH31284.1 Transcriptional regulator, TetR family [Saccharothrix espanaensis DSM 44229]
MDEGWQPRRVAAVAAELPEGVTPAGTRGRILKAALALYAETGFHGTSIRRLADRVGINSATLYSHYPSKEHVLAELVLIGHRELHTRLTDALRRCEADPAAQLAALVRAHVLAHARYPLLAAVTNSELHALAPAQLAPSLELREACRRLMHDVMAQGVADGTFSVPDPTLAAIAIGGMDMQVAQWFGPDQPYPADVVADHYARFALRIVGLDS